MAPRMKKPTKDDVDKTKQMSFFKQRFPGFKKKAIELSVLCGNSVGFICYGPNNDQVHAWPENPQTLGKIVSLFDEQNDEKKKKHSCDPKDFPRFDDGLSVEELKTYLSVFESKLVGVKQRKLQVVIKTLKAPSSKDRSRVQETGVGILDPKLGFGCASDELGYVVSGSTNVTITRSVSEWEPDKALVVSKDDGAAALAMETEGYTPTLGFESQLYSAPETCDNLPMGIWDQDFCSTLGDSFMSNTYDNLPMGTWDDLDFSSTLDDSFIMTNTCQDDWGNVNLQGFQTQSFLQPLV